MHNDGATMTKSDTSLALAQVLSQAERSVVRRLTDLAEAHGSTIEQWRVLSLLADGQGHPMKEIAGFVLVPSPTLTRIIDRMIADNLVYRRVDPADRRRVLIFCSGRGRRLHAKLRRDVERYESELAEADSSLDLRRLTSLLAQLIESSD
jgi:DNA-binding MarR family transcriptional regulator